jgi:exonuclease III
MAFDCKQDEVRLYYDGENKAVYKVSDARGFDFTSANGLIIGMDGVKPPPELLPEIEVGAEKLQKLVDEFNRLGLGEVGDDQFESLIVDPEGLAGQKGDQMNRANPSVAEKTANLETVEKIRAELMANPYTVHQARSFMEVAPILQIYSLVKGEVTIKQSAARDFSEKLRLFQPDFDMDNLTIWGRVLSPEEVKSSYAEYFEPDRSEQKVRLTSFSAAVWNIFHGGKHFTVEKDGWDSRLRIAEMLKQESADVIMMQETYSSGDFIAAELGYYFATTVDPDYLNQGSNISVLSRYPIKELFVPAGAPFNNVGVKVAVSKNQELYVMSNWYGMRSFPTVFDFHKSRFDESGSIPTVFSGDFNAVPHTDGGESAASLTLLEAGFTDAYRSLYPDVDKYPGFTHRSGSRIDQLYYKGKGLRNTSTRTISTWEGGFPSDHFLIISQFDLH